MKGRVILTIGLIPVLLILVTSFHFTTAMYSTSKQACGIRYPNDATCQGLGTSSVADNITTALNTNTVYTVVSFNPVKTIYIVLAASLNYINGIVANIIYNTIIGYVIYSPAPIIGSAYYLNVLGCPTLTRLQGFGLVPGTQNLCMNAVYQAVTFSNRPQTGQCNVIPCSVVTSSPTLASTTNTGPVQDYGGLVSALVTGLQTSSPMSNLMKGPMAMILNLMNLMNSFTKTSGGVTQFTEPGSSTVSASCATTTLSSNLNAITTNIIQMANMVMQNSGDQICTLVTSIASLFNKIMSTVVLFTSIVIISPVNNVQVLLNGYTEVTCFYAFFLSLLDSC